jgi:hypothetical protein
MVPFSVTTGAMTQRCSYVVSSPVLRTQPTTRTSTEHVETLAWMSALHAMEHVLMECLNAMENVTTKKSLHVEVYVTQTQHTIKKTTEHVGRVVFTIHRHVKDPVENLSSYVGKTSAKTTQHITMKDIEHVTMLVLLVLRPVKGHAKKDTSNVGMIFARKIQQTISQFTERVARIAYENINPVMATVHLIGFCAVINVIALCNIIRFYGGLVNLIARPIQHPAMETAHHLWSYLHRKYYA